MMPETVPFRFCLMLAFQSILAQGENVKSENAAQKIIGLAKLMNEFCDLNISQNSSEETIKFSENEQVIKIDRALDQHIEELKNKEETILPQDRETLLQFYDRLQQRKTRRTQQLFYEQGTDKQLANLILKYIDEEIEERNKEGHE